MLSVLDIMALVSWPLCLLYYTYHRKPWQTSSFDKCWIGKCICRMNVWAIIHDDISLSDKPHLSVVQSSSYKSISIVSCMYNISRKLIRASRQQVARRVVVSETIYAREPIHLFMVKLFIINRLIKHCSGLNIALKKRGLEQWLLKMCVVCCWTLGGVLPSCSSHGCLIYVLFHRQYGSVIGDPNSPGVLVKLHISTIEKQLKKQIFIIMNY